MTVYSRNPAPEPLLCLASASPRRRELLQQIGVPHVVQPGDVDETRQSAEPPGDYVLRLAHAKARHVASQRSLAALEALPVLGADTTVAIDDLVLGKPCDFADFAAMMSRLSGREHTVFSAVALSIDGVIETRLSVTSVRFRELNPAELLRYWQTGEPCDKAGGYAIQGYGAIFVQSITGSYSGVMGLPLAETAELLIAAGLPLWQAGS
jgi:septum formation protein